MPLPQLAQPEIQVKVAQDLEQYGWTILSTIYKKIVYAHTWGLLQNFAHPDMEILGVSVEMSQAFLNILSQRIKAGERFEQGTVITDLVEGYDLILTMNPFNLAGPPLTNGRLRLIWPDANHCYPWDTGCQLECRTQWLFPDSTILHREFYERHPFLN